MRTISEIEIKNFRACKDLSIDNISNILVLIGKNDIGKSSILEALNMLFNKRECSESDYFINETCATDIIEISVKINNEVYSFNSKKNTPAHYTTQPDINLEYFPIDFRLPNMSLDQIIKEVEDKIQRYYHTNCDNELLKNLSDFYNLLEKREKYNNLMDKLPIEIKEAIEHELDWMMGGQILSYDSKYVKTDTLTDKYPDHTNEILEIFDILKEFDIVDEYDNLDREGLDCGVVSGVIINGYNEEEWIYEQEWLNEIVNESWKGIIYKTKLFNSDVDYIYELPSVQDFLHNSTYSYYDLDTSDKEEVMKEAESYINYNYTKGNIFNIIETILEGYKENSQKKINVSQRGSGVKRLTYIYYNMIKSITSYSIENMDSIFVIDEPELYLYPSQQKNLIDILKKVSLTNQIIITSHSPMVAKTICEKSSGETEEQENIIKKRIKLLEKNNDKLIIKEPQKQRLNHLSVSEMNYIAFEEFSVEYHQELFGHIQNQMGVKETDKYLKGECGHSTTGQIIISPLDKEEKWFDASNGNEELNERTLPYCVRNFIDHPEVKNDDINKTKTKHNKKYGDPTNIQRSIELMRKVIEENNL